MCAEPDGEEELSQDAKTDRPHHADLPHLGDIEVIGHGQGNHHVHSDGAAKRPHRELATAPSDGETQESDDGEQDKTVHCRLLEM